MSLILSQNRRISIPRSQNISHRRVRLVRCLLQRQFINLLQHPRMHLPRLRHINSPPLSQDTNRLQVLSAQPPRSQDIRLPRCVDISHLQCQHIRHRRALQDQSPRNLDIRRHRCLCILHPHKRDIHHPRRQHIHHPRCRHTLHRVWLGQCLLNHSIFPRAYPRTHRYRPHQAPVQLHILQAHEHPRATRLDLILMGLGIRMSPQNLHQQRHRLHGASCHRLHGAPCHIPASAPRGWSRFLHCPGDIAPLHGSNTRHRPTPPRLGPSLGLHRSSHLHLRSHGSHGTIPYRLPGLRLLQATNPLRGRRLLRSRRQLDGLRLLRSRRRLAGVHILLQATRHRNGQTIRLHVRILLRAGHQSHMQQRLALKPHTSPQLRHVRLLTTTVHRQRSLRQHGTKPPHMRSRLRRRTALQHMLHPHGQLKRLPQTTNVMTAGRRLKLGPLQQLSGKHTPCRLHTHGRTQHHHHLRGWRAKRLGSMRLLSIRLLLFGVTL